MAVKIIESSLTKNDAERWIVGTYALWAEHMGGSWRCIGGYRKSEDNAEMLLNMLKRDWEIDSAESGIRQVNWLISKEYHHDPAVDAWDYCRATQLLGLFYLVGFIDRKVLADFNCTVGKILQEQFHSWKELCESYLRGCEAWYRSNFDSVKANQIMKERRDLYKKFRKQKDGPYCLSWKMSFVVTASTNAGGYYEQWQKQEESWVKAHHRHVFKQFWFILAPSVLVGTALIMGLVTLVDSSRNPFEMALSGAFISLPVLFFVQVILFLTTRKGRLRRAIRFAQRNIALDESEKELFGMELLEAWADQSHSIEYIDRPPQGLKSPALFLVSEHFFYQVNPRPVVILIRRSDLDYLEWGSQRKSYRSSKFMRRNVTLYTVYFYLQSSREQRLEGSTAADNGMGFFDKSVRDKAFFMMGGQVKQ